MAPLPEEDDEHLDYLVEKYIGNASRNNIMRSRRRFIVDVDEENRITRVVEKASIFDDPDPLIS